MWIKVISKFTRLTDKNCIYSFSKSKKDLYQLLGLSKNASQSQIKKAYYKLAQTHHPDKNQAPGAKDKFTEINNAYQILSDQNKRKMYDQTGSTDDNEFAGFENQDIFSAFRGAGFGQRGGSQNMGGFDSIFQDLFGFGGQQKGGRRENQPEKILLSMELTFEQSVRGTKKTINYQRKGVCGTCKGNKSKPGSQPQKCNTCQGTGYMTFRQGMMALKTTCNSCNGEGKKITHPCGTCKATGIQPKNISEQLAFPAGIDQGNNMRFRGKGHNGGDLQIRVTIKKNPNFQRMGVDVHTTHQISIVDAVLGCQIDVKSIYGQVKSVKIEAGSQNGDQIKLGKDGFYRVNTQNKGNHWLTLKVKVPKNISDQQKKLYEQLRQLKEGASTKLC